MMQQQVQPEASKKLQAMHGLRLRPACYVEQGDIGYTHAIHPREAAHFKVCPDASPVD